MANEVRVDAVDNDSRVSQALVVRLWLEHREPGQRRSIWRGHITHVQTREECTVDSLADIAYVCATHLLAANALLPWYERLWVRLMTVKRQ